MDHTVYVDENLVVTTKDYLKMVVNSPYFDDLVRTGLAKAQSGRNPNNRLEVLVEWIFAGRAPAYQADDLGDLVCRYGHWPQFLE
jgi:hypothetical protein